MASSELTRACAHSKKRAFPVHGWIVLDKPLGLGSTPAVGKVRRALGAQKAGHAGTLDPLATGILPVALGEATKTVPYLVDASKDYRFTLTFGHETTTGDAEGEPTERSDHRPTEADLRAALSHFTGEIEQVPPRYSAVKIGGRRAYDLARAGEAVEVPSRRVAIHALGLVSATPSTATLTTTCGKGTYIRALARDLARALGARAHVAALRRTRVGPFTETMSVDLDTLSAAPSAHLRPFDLPLDGVVPPVAITPAQRRELAFGRAFRVEAPDGEARAVLEERTLALGRVEAGRFQPKKVFAGLLEA